MTSPPAPDRPWLPYVLPMATFLILTSAEDWLPKGTAGPHPTYYPVSYAFKIAVVAFTCWLTRSTWRDLSPRPPISRLLLASAIGLLVTALWVGLDGFYPTFGGMGARAAFDPNVLTPGSKVAFLAVRMLGLVLIVPFFEELFWRSFVMRWIIDPERFEDVPIGRVTPIAAVVTAALFAVEHPAEWLPALLTGAIWAWLLHRTKSVLACFVSHAVANLGLGIYVLTTGQWKYW
ncbi:CAAX prenyl protease-related protein [Tundrisphaera lichenicola]|uniref:CAAX prenyl protease-related protein n=1 Tax=Tundrisphaera lichenicola TaxID=2029860 RepID=UPI003EB6B696